MKRFAALLFCIAFIAMPAFVSAEVVRLVNLEDDGRPFHLTLRSTDHDDATLVFSVDSYNESRARLIFFTKEEEHYRWRFQSANVLWTEERKDHLRTAIDASWRASFHGKDARRRTMGQSLALAANGVRAAITKMQLVYDPGNRQKWEEESVAEVHIPPPVIVRNTRPDSVTFCKLHRASSDLSPFSPVFVADRPAWGANMDPIIERRARMSPPCEPGCNGHPDFPYMHVELTFSNVVLTIAQQKALNNLVAQRPNEELHALLAALDSYLAKETFVCSPGSRMTIAHNRDL